MNSKQKSELKEEIKNLFDILHLEGVDFSASFAFPGKGPHDGVEYLSAENDHRVIDMIHRQMKVWSKLNHKGGKK